MERDGVGLTGWLVGWDGYLSVSLVLKGGIGGEKKGGIAKSIRSWGYCA